MKLMRLEKPAPIEDNPVQRRDVDIPGLSWGDLLLRVEACAICRTDLQLVEGDLRAWGLPIVPGHQIVGTVEGVGNGVAGWHIGQRAAVTWLAGACESCSFCRSGRENLCHGATFTGWDRDGGFAEYTTASASFCTHLPATLDSVSAAPLLCGGVIVYRSLQRSGIQPGGRIGLFGYGASAHLALQVAIHWGCEVYVLTRSHTEQRRALEIGATWAGGYKAAPDVPLDAAITFAPVGEVVIDALRNVERSGVVAINAIHLDRIPQFSYDHLWWERELRSVANVTRDDVREFLTLASEIPIQTTTQRFALDDANEALRRLKAGELTGTAVLTMP